MEILVDANKRDSVITPDPDSNVKELSDCLFGRNNPVQLLILVYGGTLKQEYFESGKAKRLIRTLDRAGRARKIDDELALDQEKKVEDLCRSDDPHIIALAQLSDARVLCTEDSDLEDDFKDPELLDPPGSIYKDQDQHRHLIVDDD